ncbi:hypothetical protein RV134_350266 [Roseovarius sp. EC-HK134]|nr:hypothetical protein RV134_350266 [Roseovarius sp. EC-HK134]
MAHCAFPQNSRCLTPVQMRLRTRSETGPIVLIRLDFDFFVWIRKLWHHDLGLVGSFEKPDFCPVDCYVHYRRAYFRRALIREHNGNSAVTAHCLNPPACRTICRGDIDASQE